MSRYTRLFKRTVLLLENAVALKVIAITLILGLTAGCTSNSLVYHDYALTAVTGPQAAASKKSKTHTVLPVTLGVFPVNVPGWLDKKNITWSDGNVRLNTSDNDHWGEPLPALLTRAMVQNFRHLVESQSWVSSGPWVRDERPEVVVFIDVQSIEVVNHQLRVSVAWSLEGEGSKVMARRDKVYALLLENTDSVQNYVQTLSRVWGLVAKDVVQAIPTGSRKTQETAS